MLIVQDLATKQKYWQRQSGGDPGHYNFKPGVVVMKFGEQLRTSIIREYQWYYIAYDELKAQLKTDYNTPPSKANPKPRRREWTEEDEGTFIDRMEQELDKVHTKQKVKAIEISRRIAASEKEVKDVVVRLESRGLVGSQSNDDAPTEEEFMMLEEDLSDIIADVHDLAKFVQLNYIGFQKIIKKHDVSWRRYSWCILLIYIETNQMDLEANFCHTTKGKTILQGQLRCGYYQAIETLRRRADAR
jgi:SPX domain protein involved in polyphosphate accumulation